MSIMDGDIGCKDLRGLNVRCLRCETLPSGLEMIMACLRHKEVTTLERSENNIPRPTEEELDKQIRD